MKGRSYPDMKESPINRKGESEENLPPKRIMEEDAINIIGESKGQHPQQGLQSKEDGVKSKGEPHKVLRINDISRIRRERWRRGLNQS